MRASWWCRAAAPAALLAAACGQPSPDLFDVRRSGGGADLRLVVSDGGNPPAVWPTDTVKGDQYAPSFDVTARNVRHRITKSCIIDQFST